MADPAQELKDYLKALADVQLAVGNDEGYVQRYGKSAERDFAGSPEGTLVKATEKFIAEKNAIDEYVKLNRATEILLDPEISDDDLKRKERGARLSFLSDSSVENIEKAKTKLQEKMVAIQNGTYVPEPEIPGPQPEQIAVPAERTAEKTTTAPAPEAAPAPDAERAQPVAPAPEAAPAASYFSPEATKLGNKAVELIMAKVVFDKKLAGQPIADFEEIGEMRERLIEFKKQQVDATIDEAFMKELNRRQSSKLAKDDLASIQSALGVPPTGSMDATTEEAIKGEKRKMVNDHYTPEIAAALDKQIAQLSEQAEAKEKAYRAEMAKAAPAPEAESRPTPVPPADREPVRPEPERAPVADKPAVAAKAAETDVAQLEKDKAALETIRGDKKFVPAEDIAKADQRLHDRLLDYKKQHWVDETLSKDYLKNLSARAEGNPELKVENTGAPTEDEIKAVQKALKIGEAGKETGKMDPETIRKIKEDKNTNWTNATYTENIGTHIQKYIDDNKPITVSVVPELTPEQKEIAELKAQMAAQQKLMADMTARLNKLVEKEPQAKVDQAQSADISTLRTDVGTNTTDISTLRTDADTARKDIGANARDIADVSRRVETVDGNAKGRDSELDGRITQESITRGDEDANIRGDITARDKAVNERVTQNTEADQGRAKVQAGINTGLGIGLATNFKWDQDRAAAQGERDQGQDVALEKNTRKDNQRARAQDKRDDRQDATTKALDTRVVSREAAEDNFYEATKILADKQAELTKASIPFREPEASNFDISKVNDTAKSYRNEVYRDGKQLNFGKDHTGLPSAHISTHGVEYQQMVFQRGRCCYCQWVATDKDHDGLVYLPKVNKHQTIQMDKGDRVLLDANNFADGQKIDFKQGQKDDRGNVTLLVEEGKKLDIREDKGKITLTLEGKTTELTGVKLSEIQLASGKNGQEISSDKLMSAEQYVADRKSLVDGERGKWEAAKKAAQEGLDVAAKDMVKASDFNGDSKLSRAEEGRLGDAIDGRNITEATVAAVVAAKQKFGDGLKLASDQNAPVAAPQTKVDPNIKQDQIAGPK